MKRKIAPFSVLDTTHCQNIYNKAIDILEHKGLRVHSDLLTERLLAAGATQTNDNMVLLPKRLIAQAVEATPSAFTLYDLKGAPRPLAQGTIFDWIMPYIEALQILPYAETHLRASNLADLQQALIVSESLDCVNLSGIITWPLELDPAQQLDQALYALLTTTQKTLVFGFQNQDQAHRITTAVKLAAANPNFSETPSVLFVSSPTSPLTVDKDSGDTLIFGLQNGLIPVLASCPMAGGTSQFSIIGTVLQQVAEELFMLTAAQTIKPETPIIWGGADAPMDMKVGNVSYGAAERSLMMLANIDMAAFLNVPAHSPAASVDSCLLDVQLGAEKAWTYLTRSISQAAIGMGIGAVTNGTAISLEQMVIDADIIASVKQFAQGIDMDHLETAFEEIKAVTPGGDFMMAEATMEILTQGNEYYYPATFNRSGTSAPSAAEKAHDKVEHILKNWQSPVSQEVRKKLHSLLLQ